MSNGIAYDSRKVKPGDTFVAIPGSKVDGAIYIEEAIKKGAKAIVTENAQTQVPVGIEKLVVPSARRALAELSSKFFGDPSKKLKVIGITGTNGKTTTAYLINAILTKAGYKSKLLGTIDTPTGLTTPESYDLQKWLAQAVADGVTHVVMEVSSHSLAQDRVWGIEFVLAIFTNLTHDHLDFHSDMANYLAAKKKLFKMSETALINADDPFSNDIMEVVRGETIVYGLEQAEYELKNAKFDDFDVKVEGYHITPEYMSVVIGGMEIRTPLIGVYNIYNILAAVKCGLFFGINRKVIKQAIEAVKNIPGRFERVECGQPFKVIVDFAHSPDALEKLLKTVRLITPKGGRIILVFGCPGDRDREKRPIMGKIAQELADHFIITTDDPHSELPEQIIAEIFGSICINDNIEKIVDRRHAIEKALKLAGPNDYVVIAGRGHEKIQDFVGQKVEIDDREVVWNALS